MSKTSPVNHVDFLIVGQGLAGTLLAYFLLQAEKKVHIIDDGYCRAASKVAAGIINPVTGRRYVKSWRIDDLLPVAEQTYRQMEYLLGISVYHPRSILRALFNPREENDWQSRVYDQRYSDFILPAAQVDPSRYARHTRQAFAYGEIVRGAQVDIGRLIAHYRDHLLQQQALTEARFDYGQVELTASGVRYGRFQAGSLIFCEGAGAAQNPFFSHLPLEGNKGEALLINIPGAQFDKILKHRVFIVPLGGDRYWIGSTSHNRYANDLPSDQGRQYLLEKLDDLLQLPYSVEDHRAAIRPTVRDRRPLLGQHPLHPRLYIFNGLGTKGASLGPFWARSMADMLLRGQKNDPEVDIGRFTVKPSK